VERRALGQAAALRPLCPVPLTDRRARGDASRSAGARCSGARPRSPSELQEGGWRPPVASRRTRARSSRRRDAPWWSARRPALRQVPACIEKHVGQGAAHLARGAQAAVVVAAVEHGPAAAAHPIHGARESGADAHHAAGECSLPVCLDDQVRMVSLARQVPRQRRADLRPRRSSFLSPRDPLSRPSSRFRLQQQAALRRRAPAINSPFVPRSPLLSAFGSAPRRAALQRRQ